MTEIQECNYLAKNKQKLTALEVALKDLREQQYTDERENTFMIQLRGPPPLKNSFTRDKPISNKRLIVRFLLT